MKPGIILIALLGYGSILAQEHYAGINTSQNTGILNATLNPAELANIATDYEVHIFSVSGNMANNKMSFGDLWGDQKFTDMLFSGSAPANLSADLEILGPSFAFKKDKWAFAITTSGKTKGNIIDINTQLGQAVISETGIDSLAAASAILANYTQKAAATTWGEISLSAAREVYNAGAHRFTAGVALKLLFPGSYARMRASEFTGSIVENNGATALTDAYSSLNFAYSGSLGDDFTDSSNFTNFFGNGLHGFAIDIGINYRWKEEDEDSYRLNAGMSFRNMGSMTFKDHNNQSNSYELNVPQGEYLNLNQFSNVSNIGQIEDRLTASGYAEITKTSTDFVVKLPALFSLYADVKVYNNWYVTAFTQQKLRQDTDDSQIPVQNIFTMTPRYATGKYEFFAPLSSNEVSGFTAGLGFRYAGFFIGSGSVVTALFNKSDTHQADAYVGYRFGF